MEGLTFKKVGYEEKSIAEIEQEVIEEVVADEVVADEDAVDVSLTWHRGESETYRRMTSEPHLANIWSFWSSMPRLAQKRLPDTRHE